MRVLGLTATPPDALTADAGRRWSTELFGDGAPRRVPAVVEEGHLRRTPSSPGSPRRPRTRTAVAGRPRPTRWRELTSDLYGPGFGSIPFLEWVEQRFPGVVTPVPTDPQTWAELSQGRARRSPTRRCVWCHAGLLDLPPRARGCSERHRRGPGRRRLARAARRLAACIHLGPASARRAASHVLEAVRRRSRRSATPDPPGVRRGRTPVDRVLARSPPRRPPRWDRRRRARVLGAAPACSCCATTSAPRPPAAGLAGGARAAAGAPAPPPPGVALLRRPDDCRALTDAGHRPHVAGSRAHPGGARRLASPRATRRWRGGLRVGEPVGVAELVGPLDAAAPGSATDHRSFLEAGTPGAWSAPAASSARAGTPAASPAWSTSPPPPPSPPSSRPAAARCASTRRGRTRSRSLVGGVRERRPPQGRQRLGPPRPQAPRLLRRRRGRRRRRRRRPRRRGVPPVPPPPASHSPRSTPGCCPGPRSATGSRARWKVGRAGDETSRRPRCASPRLQAAPEPGHGSGRPRGRRLALVPPP